MGWFVGDGVKGHEMQFQALHVDNFFCSWMHPFDAPGPLR